MIIVYRPDTLYFRVQFTIFHNYFYFLMCGYHEDEKYSCRYILSSSNGLVIHIIDTAIKQIDRAEKSDGC